MSNSASAEAVSTIQLRDMATAAAVTPVRISLPAVERQRSYTKSTRRQTDVLPPLTSGAESVGEFEDCVRTVRCCILLHCNAWDSIVFYRNLIVLQTGW